ncbi:hypothetical protein OG590_17035 [Streptomyces goshikiensis]|uniref:hypothetical protein n=1 Tax=Streptomyces TaxID=1883 RepID=UPI00056351B4|nr:MULTISPECIES: hypothetical protein [Streptomyces]AKL67193.1 hypothetical protein M444_19395 [Streptomyces sp. Mg1]RPK47934.1 hypothetical protein EES37_10025 [Streptomyces sp. ADI91-18]WSS00121.1 hypothetical protein OG224_19920 [Streptomyces goshikiensis]WSX98817.1 hypothetical protein OG590_17035 [Streptomyces goshikiensis]
MPFEDELGNALRRAGDGFTTDGHALVEAGERRGRRLVARRRAAVVGGSVLTLAVVATGGAYTGGLFGGAGGSGGPGRVDVAAPPELSAGPTKAPARGGPSSRTGSGAVSGAQLVSVFKELLPGGKVTDTEASGTGAPQGPSVRGVYDDGEGAAQIGVTLMRTDPDGRTTAGALECPDANTTDYEDCATETLADGSKVMVFQGYEYPDRREPTKLWRATLVTRQGFQVEVMEWNAPAEKGAKVSRPAPPLGPAQLKAFAASPLWHPALGDLPAAPAEGPAPDPVGADARAVLESLVPKNGITVASKGGGGDYAYLVLDDGKGASLVQVNVQEQMGAALGGHMGGATTLPDGTKVLETKQPGEKGGKGVLWWSADTLRPDGRRVVVSAFNTGNQSKPATRKEPVLTMEQLRTIALDPKWFG